MKKVIKILLSLIVIILMTFSITISYGFGVGDLTGDQTGTSTLLTTGKNIVSVITTIGIVVSTIVVAVLGVKYMIGSVEERAEYKKTLMPYFIGAVLVFGASTIAEIIYQFVK